MAVTYTVIPWLLVALGGWVVYRCISNLWLHPLKYIPGPRLASLSKLYEIYFDLLKTPGGQYVFQVDKLHERYGPVVRISPNEVHVKDLDFYDQLYALNTRNDKVLTHAHIFGLPLSLFGTWSHEEHRVRRLAIGHFFSRASVVRLEPVIHKQIRKLCAKVSELGMKGEVISVRAAAVVVTVDMITEYTFAKPAGALDSPGFSHVWEDIMTGISESVPLARCFPGVVQTLQQLPPAAVKVMNPLVGMFFDYVGVVQKQVESIVEDHERGVLKSVPHGGADSHPTIFHELLSSSLPKHEKGIPRLTQEGMGLVGAAGETTSVVISTTIFHIISKPGLGERLRDELSIVMAKPDSLTDWQSLEKLPLLSAVVREGLRITQAVSCRLPLKINEDLVCGDVKIPAQCIVSMSPRDAMMDPAVYPNPHEFNPDRWLQPMSAEQKRLMDRAFLPFNKGPRMCPGFNLANSDIYHFLAALFRRFEFVLVDTLRGRDVDMVRDYFIAKPAYGSKGVRVKMMRDHLLDERRAT